VIYFVWIFTPDEYLIYLGITYYPDRYWALIIPIYFVIVWFFCIWIYFLRNLASTHPLDSKYTISDDHSLPFTHKKAVEYLHKGIPPITDIPLSLVNKIMYKKEK